MKLSSVRWTLRGDEEERLAYTRERNQVHSKFAEIAVELPGETQAGADTTHNLGD